MVARTKKRIGIIVGGLGGLASACTLAARGHEVTLFDKNDWIGGKAAVLEGNGFRFDMGPTILTLPSVLKRIFGEAGHKLEDRLNLVRLDPQWRCFYQDGSHLDLNKISHKFFFWKSIGSIWDMFNFKESVNLSTLGDVMAMRPTSTVADTVRKFVPDERVAQMLDHFTQYVGSSPYGSPAVLCGIAHMQTDEGIWYPMGGTREVPKALAKLAGELGVKIHSGIEVTRIEQDSTGHASGVVEAGGAKHSFEIVVSNSDSVRTHRELLAPGRAPDNFEARRGYEPACSGVVLYLGLNKRYDHIAHHDFVFSRDAHEEFDHIYNRGEPAPDPTCYVCAPSSTDPSVAPPGGEALYVLVHTPYLRPHHNWAEMLPKYREVILDKLETTGGMKGIRDRIVFEGTLTPQGIHDRYRVLNGAIYGLASHGRLFGAFKPANRSPDVPGLYLAGGSAHPGAGMPMALMSGWIAGDTVDQDVNGPIPAAS